MSERSTRSIHPVSGAVSLPLVVSTMLPAQGATGVQTHFQQVLKQAAKDSTTTAMLITPFSWGRPLYFPIYGLRRLIDPVNGPASVFWYRYWHEIFLRNALRNQLTDLDDCVIYAQDPPAARAALAVRRHRGQKVVLAVHFRISQADEWADKGKIPRNGKIFQSMQKADREVIPEVNKLVYVSRWAQEALLSWLPEAAKVPSAIIGNFVSPWQRSTSTDYLGDLVTVGHLEPVKNHRFLLQVLAEAKRAGHALSLDIYGEGPLRKELQWEANDLGLAEQVRFRGFRRDLRDFLSGYRAYVHASYSESSSLAIMEAMDAGLPIVAADIGPIGELFDDGVEGRFWPLSNTRRAAAVLLELLGDEPNRIKVAQAARERFKRYFDANVVWPQLQSFLLDDHSARPT